MKEPAIYIVTNFTRKVLYTGVTSDIIKRIYQHKHYAISGFAMKYKCNILVYYELHDCMYDAISIEKQIKAGSRVKKIKLIQNLNPEWEDLYYKLI